MATTDLGMPGLGPLQSAAPYPLRLVLNWGRRYSLWVFNFGLACCAIEFIAGSVARHDFMRLGVIPFAHGPRQADLMIVSGTVTDKMAPAVRRLYSQMPDPKYVISFGACSNSGGPYWDSYCVTKGVDQIIPVDVYVPGCPPRPESLLQAIVKLQEKIAGENLGRRYRRRDGASPVSAAAATRPLVTKDDAPRRAPRRPPAAPTVPVRPATAVLPSAPPPTSPVQAVTLRPHVPQTAEDTADMPTPLRPPVPSAAEDTADMPTPPLPQTAEDTVGLPTSPVPQTAEDTADMPTPLPTQPEEGSR